MKKLIIILSLFVCNITLTAQTNDLSAEAFVANAQTLQNSIREKFKTKDYESLEKLITESIMLFSRLSDENQTVYKDFQAKNYYNLACVYALQNKNEEAIDAFEKSIPDYKAMITKIIQMLEPTPIWIIFAMMNDLSN
ncbi:MAG: tetratricopeptide repeat protein [Prevotellaceae bacterium]|jgi:tetratricopeptide (TPR) repeat protein|nr:tetratricopeptide repeat protein [Prevotellaceae bacterium]